MAIDFILHPSAFILSYMSPGNSSEEPRSFWPRAGPAGPVPDLGDDRPCGNCSYNLRGLPFDAACPECGAVWGIDPSAEPIAWDDEQNFFTYCSTVFAVIVQPRDLAAHVWQRDRPDLSAAARFRHINVAVGTICLAIATYMIILRLTSAAAAGIGLPIDLMSIFLWLNGAANAPQRFFADKGASSVAIRLRAFSQYLTAPLALSPLHVALLPISLRGIDHFGDQGWMVAVGLHATLLLLQALLGVAAGAGLLWQVVEIPRHQATWYALGGILIHAFAAAAYLVGIPALVAAVANSFGHG